MLFWIWQREAGFRVYGFETTERVELSPICLPRHALFQRPSEQWICRWIFINGFYFVELNNWNKGPPLASQFMLTFLDPSCNNTLNFLWQQVAQISCGGWRRPHSFYLGDIPEMQNCFAYVKVHLLSLNETCIVMFVSLTDCKPVSFLGWCHSYS